MRKIWFPALHSLRHNGWSSRSGTMEDEKRRRQLCGGVEEKGKGFMEEATWTEH